MWLSDSIGGLAVRGNTGSHVMRNPPATRMCLIKCVPGMDEESAGGWLRGIMETYAFIPFAAVIVSAAFGAVSIAWDSDRRATRSMGPLFLCTGVWACIDLMTYVETDAADVLRWMRWSYVAPLMAGPCVLWVVAKMLPQSSDKLLGRARWGALICFPVGVASALAPGSFYAVVPTDFGGWMPVLGPVSIVLVPSGIVLPMYAAIEAKRTKARAGQVSEDGRLAWAFQIGIIASILLAIPTGYLLPLMEIPFPRLGALAVSISSVLVWMHVLYATDDLAMTPPGVSSGVLAKLRDGVALVGLDGAVLSTNQSFAEMVGLRGGALLGRPLSSLIDAPLDRVRMGIQDGKSVLRSVTGATVPVSLSSSIARDRSGCEIGVVIVFRDMREVDALRNQLLDRGRLAAIGELAAGIAHEVNNPLAFIRSDLNILAERVREIRECVGTREKADCEVHLFDRGERRVTEALEGIDRVTEVVGDVREFAHLGGAGQGGSDPKSVVDGAMRLARLQRGADVELRISAVECSDRIDSGQELKQVLVALFRVLVEASEKGGTIEADLRTGKHNFMIGVSAGPFVESASGLLERFEVLSGEAREDLHSEFDLGVSSELLARLGGGMTVEATGVNQIRVEVSVPLDAQARA